MTLGIMVTTDRNAAHLAAIASAAVRMGHDVSVFFTGDGVRLLPLKELGPLALSDRVDAAYCAFNAMLLDVPMERIPDSFKAASQVENLMMARSADRVITL